MIEGLKPYAKYKQSGCDWLGGIPSHWNVASGRACFNEIYTSNKGMVESTVLSLSYGRIVVKPVDKLHGLVPASFETYQVVEVGDIIVRPTDLQNDWNTLRTAMSPHKGIITSAYIGLRVTDNVRPEFGERLLRTYDLMKIFYGLGSGLRQNLSWSDFKSLPCLLPPPDEQAAIVRFLDHANRKIDGFIRAKRKLIGLLNEQKQAIIHRAVTCGLHPDVPPKPSGIPWLGDIPKHWDIQRLGRIARIFNGTTPSRNKPSYWSGGTIPWLPSGKVNDHIVTSASEFVTSQALRECSISLVPKRSVIIGLVGQGKTRGMSALLAIDACINQNLAAIIPRSCLDSAYLLAFLTAFYREVREFGRGGNQEALNCEIVGNLRVSMPPLNEQLQLVSLISSETRDITTAIARTEREITLLQEYRTRLTADLVTGKLDVREAAAKLPDEDAERDSPVDDSFEGDSFTEEQEISDPEEVEA